MKKGIGIKLTSIGLAALMTVTGPFVAKAHAEDYNPDNTYSYNISYVKDESGIVFEDQYTEALMNQYRMAPDSQVIKIPEEFEYDVRRAIKDISDDEEITIGHLRKITRLFISSSYDDTDMSWLNYCTNLEDLFISGDVCNHLDDVIGLDHLKVVSLSIAIDQELQLDHCAFLKHSPEIEKLCIYGQCDPEYLYQLDNVRGMDLSVFFNRNVDFRRLSFLDNLTLNGGAYDIAIHLSNDDIAYLESKGVNITKGGFDDTTMEDVKRINEKLDEIVKSLNISPNATDEEKIDAVLIYCLEHLEYDEEVSNLLDNGRESEINHNHFYQDGDLYGALELDTQICGNYAALMEALLYRVGVNSYVLSSSNHGWNLVEVDGEYFYVDATWLDTQNIVTYTETTEKTETGYSVTWTPETHKAEDVIASGDEELMGELRWYRVNPGEYSRDPNSFESDQTYGSHQAYDFPLSIVEVTSEKSEVSSNNATLATESENTNTNTDTSTTTVTNTDTESKEEKNFAERLFDVTIGNKTFRITGAVLIGILTSLGIAISVRRKKEQERLRRRRQQQQQQYFNSDPFGFDSYGSGSSYDYSSFGGPPTSNPFNNSNNNRRRRH